MVRAIRPVLRLQGQPWGCREGVAIRGACAMQATSGVEHQTGQGAAYLQAQLAVAGVHFHRRAGGEDEAVFVALAVTR